MIIIIIEKGQHTVSFYCLFPCSFTVKVVGSNGLHYIKNYTTTSDHKTSSHIISFNTPEVLVQHNRAQLLCVTTSAINYASIGQNHELFCLPQLLWCMDHRLSFAFPCVPFLSPIVCRCWVHLQFVLTKHIVQ